MRGNRILLGCVFLYLLCCAEGLWAQCAAVTSDGTAVAGQVAQFTTDCNIEPSAINQSSSGNIGIGKIPSSYKLDVGGTAVVRGVGLVIAPKFSGVTFPITDISGCSTPFQIPTIAFAGQSSCSFSLAGANGTTWLGAPTEVDITLDSTESPIASFDHNGSTFHTPAYFLAALTASTLNTSGNVEVGGSLNVSGTKNFKIDDPLDPENKYMYHAAVESSEVMNIYTGNVTTDAAGDACVRLPVWFEALNRDFRYQLTVIGQFSQAIVASKIADHSFRIKTDKPNVEVSWQITGLRQDAYAKAHPLAVEEDKPADERGYYLHPELFGQPLSKAISYAHKTVPTESRRLGREGN